jgi:hypothetical protein
VLAVDCLAVLSGKIKIKRQFGAVADWNPDVLLDDYFGKGLRLAGLEE